MIAPPGVTIPSHLLLVDKDAAKTPSSSKKDNESKTLQGEYDMSILVWSQHVTLIADCTYYQQRKGVRDVDSAQAAREKIVDSANFAKTCLNLVGWEGRRNHAF